MRSPGESVNEVGFIDFVLMCECWKPVGRLWTPSVIYAQLLRMLNSEP